jgi:hypothetical protein
MHNQFYLKDKDGNVSLMLHFFAMAQ